MILKSSFALATVLAVAPLGAHAADTLQVSTETSDATSVASPEVDAMQAEPVGPVKPVLVVNPPSMPVPVDGQVRVVNTPDVNVVSPVQTFQAARKPINKEGTLGIFDGERIGDTTVFTVPDGKQLVITHVSVAVAESSRVSLRLDLSNGGGFFAIHDLPPTRSGQLILGEADAWVASLSTEIYVQANAKVGCSALREDSSGNASGRCTIAGYLVDAPE